MLPSFVLALREGVEAALIVGILLGALRKLRREDLSPSVWWGTIAAAVVSILVALGLTLVGAGLEYPAEAIFEGLTMLAAAALLTWMIFWMHRQSRSLKGRLEEDVRQALGRAGRGALFLAAFAAVLREGVELAFFLAAAGMATNPTQELLGAVLGLAGAVALGWLLFTSTRRLPLSTFFTVTNVLLILFAAGLVSQAVHEFNELGWVPAVLAPIYNISPVLSDESLIGQLMKVLLGYNPSPSLTETFAYLVYFAVLSITLIRLPRQRTAKPA